MKFTNEALKRVNNEAEKLFEEIKNLEPISISKLDSKSCMAVFVDIINGFINEGAMASERVGDIIPSNVKLLKLCKENNIITAAFADCHDKCAAEFASFPPHCIKGTSESEIVSELKDEGGYILIPKNSTNGFNEQKFRDLLECHHKTDTFIVTGDCTDICVMQFALSLKAYFDQLNRQKNVAVVENAVQTFDSEGHDGDKMHIFAIYNMIMNGVSVYSI